MNARIITIDLGSRSYDIHVGGGTLHRLGEWLPFDMDGKKAFIVTDENVRSYADGVRVSLQESGASEVFVKVLPAGESSKSLSHFEDVCTWCLENRIGRDSVVFAVGGGVVGDITGFCASSVLRGVPYVQVPTTLLSQVDSSVGGKTGVNTLHGKNLIGSFYQPVSVIADTDTLKTLSERELLAGYAEVVKYGLIGDSGFFHWLEENGRDVISLKPEAIARAVEVSTKAKALIVQADEKEQGRRALLNLGHTFGHALEAVAGYDGSLLHGEAVAVGTVMAFDLSVRAGLCPAEDMERVERHFTDMGLPTRVSFIRPALKKASVDDILDLMKQDKKVVGGQINFVLVKGIGEAFLSADVSDDMVRAVVSDSFGGDDQGDRSEQDETNQKGIKGPWTSAFSSL